MGADGPTLETERLVMRPLSIADLGPLHELYGDPDAMRWAGGPSEDTEKSAARLQRFIDHQERHGFSFWGLVERESGTLIGDAGLIHLAFQGPEIEVGYRIKVPYWGKGYATEAATAWIEHGLGELGLERIVGVTHPDNVASQRVLEKAGLRFERMSRYKDERVRLYAVEAGP